MNESMHPEKRQGDGLLWLIVQCPDCGQLEWWTVDEILDHGNCRSYRAPCVVCGMRELTKRKEEKLEKADSEHPNHTS